MRPIAARLSGQTARLPPFELGKLGVSPQIRLTRQDRERIFGNVWMASLAGLHERELTSRGGSRSSESSDSSLKATGTRS
jgi:hypothetical protein